MRKEIQKIKSGLLERNLSLLKIGSKGAGFALKKIFKSDVNSFESFLKISGEFSELKGSLMKAGQLLSIYGESFLPEEAIKFLSTLQDQSSYVLFRSLKKELSVSEKMKLDRFKIKDKPFASASIGQVHLGVDKESGKEFAIKIQYPDIEKSIDNDLFILRMIFSFFKVLPKKIDLKELLEEVKVVLNQELNYEIEGEYQQFFYKHLGKEFIIPKFFKKYSERRILVSAYTPGVSIDEFNEGYDVDQEVRNDLGKSLMRLLLKELFIFQKIQSDPNPGNFKIDIESMKWILYDFGACVEIDDYISQAYLGVVKGLMDFDIDSILDNFYKLEIAKSGDPEKYLTALVEYCEIVSEVFQEGEFDWGENDIETRLTQAGKNLMLHFPRSKPPFKTSFIDRKISGTFFLLRKLKSINNNSEIFTQFFNEEGIV